VAEAVIVGPVSAAAGALPPETASAIAPPTASAVTALLAAMIFVMIGMSGSVRRRLRT